MSDLHLGHRKITIPVMVSNLTRYVFPRIPHAKMLIIGGDFFDSLLTLSRDESNLMISFIIDMLTLADKHGVIVRVLQGTWTHDRTQCHLFQVQHQGGGFTNDFRFIDTLTCEYIEALDLKCLWIPDDLQYPSSDAILEQIHQKLHDLGWDSVDHVFLHGSFAHVLPPDMPRLPPITFRARQFAGIVKRAILCGHIHTGSAFEETYPEGTVRIYYAGSFERVSHGEEEAKGFFFVRSSERSTDIEFVENQHATKFITFDLSRYTETEIAVKKYISLVEKRFHPDEYGYVRVVHGSAQIRNTLRKVTNTQFPRLSFSHKSTVAVKAPVKIQSLVTKQEYTTPTSENLPGMVTEFLRSRLHATEDQVGACLSIMATLSP